MTQQSDQQAPEATRGDILTRHRFLPTRAGIIELIILFGLLIAVETVIMSPGDFAKLQPHPYWLPVILLSLQYGTADGVLAAATAIVVGLLLGWPSQGIGEDYYRYVIRVWAVPIAWIMASIVIGEVRARQRSQIVELTRGLATARQQAETITDHCYKLEDKIQRLEREFATIEAASLGALAASLHDLQRGTPREWQTALARAHRNLVAAGSVELLLRAGDAYVPVAWTAADGQPAVAGLPAAALAGLLDRTIEGRRALSALDPQDAAELDGLVAMAVPVSTAIAEPRSGDTQMGRAAGVLLLAGLAPEHLTTDTENRLALLAREIGQALAVRGYEDLVEQADRSRYILRTTTPEVATGSPDTAARRIGLFPRFGRA